jgi:ribosome-binding factor A
MIADLRLTIDAGQRWRVSIVNRKTNRVPDAMSKRTQQIGEEIQHILSEIIQYELKDPRVGFATVVGVDVSADLQHAKVRISVLDAAERTETMAALERAKGFMRHQLAQQMRHMRSVPELHLVLDTSLDYSMHIDEVLRQVELERRNNPPHPSDEH